MRLDGEYRISSKDFETKGMLPNTLDEIGIGELEKEAESWHPDAEIRMQGKEKPKMITTRLTRKHAYDGKVTYEREVSIPYEPDRRFFVEVERTRKLNFAVDGIAIEEYEKGTLSTPYIYEITKQVEKKVKEEKKGELLDFVFTFICDNTYEGWPAKSIRVSSAATNETQTNWNGLLGELKLYDTKKCLIHNGICYTKMNENHLSLDMKIILDVPEIVEDEIRISSECIAPVSLHIKVANDVIQVDSGQKALEVKGEKTYGNHRYMITLSQIPVLEDVKLWDEYEGNLYCFHMESESMEEYSFSSGLRVMGTDENGMLTCNGHPVLIRSEANCCAFGLSGHMPLTKNEWITCLMKYKSYGLNSVRFHSHCPPKAAFEAADEMGFFLQPELSNWDPRTAFMEEGAYEYYDLEMTQILSFYGNHPSFISLSLGNELAYPMEAKEKPQAIMSHAKCLDKTRLYIESSNGFYGTKGIGDQDDFYTSANFYEETIRATNANMQGHLNECYPNTRRNYSSVLKKIKEVKKIPVISFEVGQYEVLPDLQEMDGYTGVTIPNNLNYVKEQIISQWNLPENELLTTWNTYVEASGELSCLCYREEVEAVLRTKEMSGISLLGIQDFPGQGTALVGMMNSLFKTKPFPFASPERWKTVCGNQVPLVLMDRYTYRSSDLLLFDVIFVNYGKENLSGELEVMLVTQKEEIVVKKESVSFVKSKAGDGLAKLHTFAWDLQEIKENTACELRVKVFGKENVYPVWVYVEDEMLSLKEENNPFSVCITGELNEALGLLKDGEKVLYCPDVADKKPKNSIRTNFSTDFWSMETFPSQEGYMGICVDSNHPLFRYFPTKFYSEWQWWSLTNGCAYILPESVKPVFPVLDSITRLRRLGFLIETNVRGFSGKLMICGMGLLEKRKYPEVNAFLYSLCHYMDDANWMPKQEIAQEMLFDLCEIS